LPFGTHHIDPNRAASQFGLFADFLASNKGLLTKKAMAARETMDSKKENSNDPAVRLGVFLYREIPAYMCICLWMHLHINIGNSNSFIDIYAYSRIYVL
jgi:hypothetical protein